MFRVTHVVLTLRIFHTRRNRGLCGYFDWTHLSANPTRGWRDVSTFGLNIVFVITGGGTIPGFLESKMAAPICTCVRCEKFDIIHCTSNDLQLVLTVMVDC